MRNKTLLVLLEQLVMVLVFALSAAFCLRVFVLSDRISREQETMTQAVLQAQNMAELLKGSSEYRERVSETGTWCYQEVPGYRVEVEKVPEQMEGLEKVMVRVLDSETGQEYIQIPVAWQEVAVYE